LWENRGVFPPFGWMRISMLETFLSLKYSSRFYIKSNFLQHAVKNIAQLQIWLPKIKVAMLL
jgi:hypothetical protein